MSEKYKIYDNDKAYFVTLTTVGWIDVFTRPNHKLKIVESLKYCQQNKGLVIFGWCLMPSHLHMIVQADGDFTLSEILRDFKKFTAKKIINQIEDEPESRREWMLEYFQRIAKPLKRIKKYKFWQDGNQAKIIFSKEFFYEKLEYIHNNPVQDLIIEKPEDYLFSSARNYAGLDALIEVIEESSKLITY
ncbi:transposase [Bacteroidota bacterium]